MMGSGIGGLQVIYDNSISFNEVGMKKISPFFIPSVLINLISGNLSIKYGLKGPNHSCVTACSTGTHAIGDAAAMIARGDADLMVAGGAESAVNVLGLAGFARMKAVTSDFNEYLSPKKHPVRGMKTAAVLLWARGPVRWFWKNWGHAQSPRCQDLCRNWSVTV